jgi:threonine/homoserine/homoserine lactone efflux protein
MSDSILAYIIPALVLGGSAAISPGPLNTLVISESLKKGSRGGIRIAIAPILTDAPIIAGSFWLVNNLSSVEVLLNILSLLGGIFLIYLGMKDILVKSNNEKQSAAGEISSIKKGILTNLLSPNPYIFWLTIGAPLLISASELSIIAAVLFILIFYVLLVGFKILLALFTDQVKSFFASRSFQYIVRALGVVIMGFGVYLIYKGAAGVFIID